MIAGKNFCDNYKRLTSRTGETLRRRMSHRIASRGLDNSLTKMDNSMDESPEQARVDRVSAKLVGSSAEQDQARFKKMRIGKFEVGKITWLDDLFKQHVNFAMVQEKKLIQRSTGLRKLYEIQKTDKQFDISINPAFVEIKGVEDLVNTWRDQLRTVVTNAKEEELKNISNSIGRIDTMFMEAAQKLVPQLYSEQSDQELASNTVSSYLPRLREAISHAKASIRAEEISKQVKVKACLALGNEPKGGGKQIVPVKESGTFKANSETRTASKKTCAESAKEAREKNQNGEKVINSDYFFNLSSIKVPSEFLDILNAGYKFINPVKADTVQLIKEFDQTIQSALYLYPSFMERASALRTTALIRMTKEVETAETKRLGKLRNLNRWLIKNKLIIKAADKNLGLTIMDIKQYETQVMKHLENIEYYKKAIPCVEKINAELFSILNLHQTTSQKTARSSEKATSLMKLINHRPIEPEFYVMPKVHKNPVAFRPIVPNINWVTTNASKWLDKLLQPIVKSLDWIVKNTMECISVLEEYQLYKHSAILVAADVESMYTNIDLDEGIQLIQKSYITPHYPENAELIGSVLNWVLRNNFFKFNGTSYQQIKGTAMGTNIAPCFANLFMAAYEEEWMKLPNFPSKYFRFLDDIFFVYTKSHEKLTEWCGVMQKTSPSLKFTFQKGSKVTFLDLEISLGEKFASTFKLDYNLFDKPTNRHIYTSPDSYQPYSYKYSWITGENVRLIRNSDSEEKYRENQNTFIQNLEKRNYDPKTVRTFLKYDYVHRYLFLTSKTEKKHNELAPLFIKNRPGRDILVKELRYIFYTEGSDPQIPLVVLRGRNIWDNFNSVNKKLLSTENNSQKRTLEESNEDPKELTKVKYKKPGTLEQKRKSPPPEWEERFFSDD